MIIARVNVIECRWRDFFWKMCTWGLFAGEGVLKGNVSSSCNKRDYNEGFFKEILERTADSFAFPEDIVEKDYYVFLILRQIKQLCPLVVFKGGTSLSKAFML